MPDFENEPKNQTNSDDLIAGRVSLHEVRKQVAEIKEAKKTFEAANPKSKRMFDAVSMYSTAVDFALIIAIPLIAFVYAGRWMDAKYGTKFYVLIGILLGITISSISIANQIKKLSAQLKSKPKK